jgi:ABC-type lipoprotein release transport system permease subunit
MTFFRLLVRNLVYHWRGNLAVFLGVALGTAVLTGALLVGDSLRGSLRALTLDRLGWVEQAMVPGRFFRERLAGEVTAPKRSAAILLSGSAANGLSGAQARRAGGVTVLGVDASFWQDPPPAGSAFWQSQAAEVVLNRTLADLLGVKEGDAVALYLQKAEDIPRESLLGKRKAKDVVQSLELKVRQVVPDEGLARFTLKPTPEPARNAFVPLRFLQSELGLAGQANAVLIAGAGPNLAGELRQALTLEDWGLRLRTPRDRALAFVKYLSPNDDSPPTERKLAKARWRGRIPAALQATAEKNGNVLTAAQVIAFYEEEHPYLSLESRQLILAPPVGQAADRAARSFDAPPPAGPRVMLRPTLVYLVDTLTVGSQHIPYVVVAGGERIANNIGDDEIVLVEQPENGIGAAPTPLPETVLAYYVPDEHNHLQRKEATFRVRGVIPLAGPADDPDLTPEFPGITDQLDMGSWVNPPFPYDPKRINSADEKFWERHRATPRAYVSLATAQRLWGSRFGQLTSIRVFLDGVRPDDFKHALLSELHPEQGGFVFQPVHAQAEEASNGSADFGVLFLSFSFFLIASALLLVGLLFRLNLDRRASEVGLLMAIGWTPGRVRGLLLGEGAVLAVLGGAVGLAGALVYARLMLDLLRASWPGGEALNFLRLHVDGPSLIYGYAGSLLVSLLTILWATRVLSGRSPRSLLAGETTPEGAGERRGRPWSVWVLGVAAAGAAACLVAGFFVQDQEAKAGSFFGSGALLLTACLAGVWIWLKRTGRQSTPQPSLTALGLRNAGRHAVRSLLTVGLLAAAAFLIVAVESFHKEAAGDFTLKTGGRLALIAETDVPVFQDLNRPETRKELGLTGDPLFAKVWFYPCRVRGGDDASCLNLYRPLEPRVMGLPPGFLEAWRPHFGGTLAPEADGTVPAYLDANTAEWILKKKLGDVIEVDNERGEKVKLRVVALLQESIFQSEILISEEDFRKAFPGQEGFSFFLVECKDCSDGEVRQVQTALEAALADEGVRVRTPAQRLQAYLAVENTYLATFQALGGLGLILGAAGLAIVLLRGVWERRGELALLRALGFRPARLAWLVLAENLALLLLGLAAGTVAALLSVAPHLAGVGAPELWLRIGVLLLLVLASGLVAGGLAVFTTVRAPLLTALRRE